MEKVNTGASFDPGMTMNSGVSDGITFKNSYKIDHFDSAGNLLYSGPWHNLVTTAGLNDLLTKYFKGSSYTAVWACGLKGQGSPSAGDVSSSHAGWSEITTYSAGSRAQLTLGTPSGGSVDNSASVSIFTATVTATIAGAFISSSTAKIGGTGSGDTGVLYAVGDFTSARVANPNDVLNITVTFTAS